MMQRIPPKGGLVRDFGRARGGLVQVGNLPANLVGGVWRMIYTNGRGVVTEVPIEAAGYTLVSNGAASAPTMKGPWVPNVVTIAF